MFCLPDPYGCSCATGWMGLECDKGIVKNMGNGEESLMCYTYETQKETNRGE